MDERDNPKGEVLRLLGINYKATKHNITGDYFKKYDPGKLARLKDFLVNFEYKNFLDESKNLVIVTDDVDDTKMLVQVFMLFLYKSGMVDIKNFDLLDIHDLLSTDGVMNIKYMLRGKKIISVENFIDDEIIESGIIIPKDRKYLSDSFKSLYFEDKTFMVLGVTVSGNTFSTTAFDKWGSIYTESLKNLIKANSEVVDVRRA